MPTPKQSMDWIRRAGEYRVLLAKRDDFGQQLDPAALGRLAELERFFTRDANRRRLPWATREQVRAPISILVHYGDSSGRARDISGEGMFVATPAPLGEGARTVVRIVDPEDGDSEWRFPVEVVRVTADPQSGMGLRFVGIPLELRLGHAAARMPSRRAA